MKASLAIMLALAATAHAQPARKQAPDKFSRAASEAFKRATADEDNGKLRAAASSYRDSLHLALHPNTAYNLAAVEERDGSIADAIIDYEVYLTLAPNAPDAAAVRAKITELEKRPAILTVEFSDDFDPAGAYVVLDGVIIKRPGDLRKGKKKVTLDLKLARGTHSLEVITVIGYNSDYITTVPGQKLRKEMDEGQRSAGNVSVISDHHQMFQVGPKGYGFGRFSLPPGKHLLPVFDHDLECPPVTINAPANDDVAYTKFKFTEPDHPHQMTPMRCRKFEIIQQTLTFK